jgi:2-keto-4-pentenoate hydratase/2-oxohepta-3-ene-1,7-dioic acid hydratase in catechol pathway
MKLVRFGKSGEERPGILFEEAGHEKILDVRASAFDIEDYNEHFFSHHGIKRLEALLKESKRKIIPAKGVRLGPPIARPSKIICLGQNYADHAKECNAKPPESPILFSKATTAIIGPRDKVMLPPLCGVVDGEVELAVVIGARASRVSEKKALDHVAGYMIFNDVTDRDAQRIGKQLFRGKGADTFCPLGPWLVIRDEIADPHNLKLKFTQNGKVLQDGTTKDMIFKIPYIIEFISASMTLLSGDVIATGTPAGIGSAHKPPVVFKPGDRIELEVEGLGRQANEITSAV